MANISKGYVYICIGDSNMCVMCICEYVYVLLIVVINMHILRYGYYIIFYTPYIALYTPYTYSYIPIYTHIERGGRLDVIGNLPYNVTSQILFNMADNYKCIRKVVITSQWEVCIYIVCSVCI